MKSASLTLAVLVSLGATAVNAELLWSARPAAGHPGMTKGDSAHGGHGGRGSALYLHDGQGAEAQLWSPVLTRSAVFTGEKGRVSPPSTGFDNYHALVAKRREDGLVETAIRYQSMRGKPSGRSPAELASAVKSDLELEPQPLPREHSRYMSGGAVRFVVRFHGTPVADSWVGLTTSNGTSLEGHSDARGRVEFTLPDDFQRVIPGRQNNRPAELVVRAGVVDGGTLYRTNLSAPYYVNPDHWRSTTVGAFVLGAGFVTGLLLTRRGRDSSAGGTVA